MAAHSRHAQGGTSTAAGTAAFLAKFERQVDPDGTLPPAERARRAEHARKAHMTGLALASSRARDARTTRENAKAAPAIVTPEAAQEVRGASHERPSAA
jgi:hypothetical protein